MPTDAKLGFLVGIILVVMAAWTYRAGRPSEPPAPAVSPATDAATEPVLLPDPSH